MDELPAVSNKPVTSYVVRIYRRIPGSEDGLRRHDAITLVGIVERSDTGERRDFHDIEQLWAILCGEKN